MKTYTSDEVERAAAWTEINVPGEHYLMLRELAHRLRREEEENQRNPATDPRHGDRMILPCGWEWTFVPYIGNHAACSETRWQAELEKFPDATLVRRRELPSEPT